MYIHIKRVMADEKLEFDDLNLTFGQQVLVHPNPEDKRLVSSCSLIGVIAGECLILGACSAGECPAIHEGKKVVIRIFLDDGVAAFQTTALFVSEVPIPMVYLDFPRAIKFKRLRAAKRVKLAHPVLASNLDHPEIAAQAGKLLDLSTGGGRVEMFDKLGDVGDHVKIKGKFHVHGITKLLTIKGVIRQAGNNCYGIQFIEEDEDKLIVLMGFVFNAMLEGKIEGVR